MARYIGSVCRLCRREGMKLFLKGERCFTDKCAADRRQYAPGQHGQARSKLSEYGIQLREKQKIRRIYGVLERQFRLYFERAERMRGITGSNLISLLERRLDNVVFRLGFSMSRSEARQMVRHGHILVNGRKVNIPSFLVKVGDKVEVREKSRKIQRIADSLGAVSRRPMPSWLDLDKAAFAGAVRAMPVREELTLQMNEQLVVELYSR